MGGYQLSFELYGKLTAEIAQRVLEGEAPSNIPIIKHTDWPYIFDWRELKRWNIDERDLPKGSIVRYRELSFWDLYRGYIIGGFFIFLLQGFFMLRLVVQRKRGKEREQLLRAIEERYSAFVKNSTEGIFCIEFDTEIYLDMPEDEQLDLVFKHAYYTEANDVYARTCGLEHAEELKGVRIAEFLSRSDPKNIAFIKAWIQGHYNVTNVETVEIYKDGRTRYLLNNAVSTIEAGRVVRVWCTFTDITESRQSQEQLILAEQRYRTVADFTFDWEYWESPEGIMLYVSPSCERITGFTTREFTEKPELIHEIIIQKDRDVWNDHRHQENNRLASRRISFRIQKKDDEIRWIEHACLPVYDEKGEFLGTRASNRDITVRKRIEEDLKKKDNLLTEALSIAHMGSWEWNIISNELIWSDEIYKIFGISSQEFEATYESFLKRVHPDDRLTVKEALNLALSDPSSNYNIVHRIRKPDGSERIVRERGKVTFDDTGKASHMIGTVQDVTEIKTMEAEKQKLRAELSRMDRIGMLGVLTAGIAHEVNQPLTAILSNAQAALRFLTRDLPDLDEVKEATHDIVSDAKRAGKIVHSIRNIMGRSELKNENIDFNETVREVLTIVKSEALDQRIFLAENLAPDLPFVNGDRIHIQQVILNLLKNALEAMKDHITPNPKILISTWFKINDGVILSVSDSGPGIKPGQFTDIFEAFHTTKTNGLGIGLSMCRSIAEEHGGSIWAENRPEGGATFFLKLPTGEN